MKKYLNHHGNFIDEKSIILESTWTTNLKPQNMFIFKLKGEHGKIKFGKGKQLGYGQ